MTYAARDAQVSVALFFHLLGLHSEASSLSPDSGSAYSQLASQCQGLVDMPFKGRCGADGEEKTPARRSRKPTFESPESGDQQVPDPRKNKRKPLGVGYSAR